MAAHDARPADRPPPVWAHCETAEAYGAMAEIGMRIQQYDSEVKFWITAPSTLDDVPNDVERLDISNAATLQEFLSEIRPELALFVDTPVTVAPIGMCTRMRIPVALINVQTETIRRRPWIWRKTILPGALKHVDRVFTFDEASTNLWRKVGIRADRIQIGELLSGGVVAPTCNEDERGRLSKALSSRPVWFLQSIPVEEFDWALDAIQTAQRSWPRLVTILDARLEQNVSGFKNMIQKSGLIVHDRAMEGEPDALTQVFLTDDPEEVGIWYRLASLTYLGGTLSGQDSANPMHAASLGSAIIHGPQITRHRSAFARLDQANATNRISHGRQLGDTVALQLAPDACAEKAHKAWEVTYESAEMTDTLTEYIAYKLGIEMVN